MSGQSSLTKGHAMPIEKRCLTSVTILQLQTVK